jgi:hypothetical protein
VKLSSKVKEWGFVANPYDLCVMTKIVNGKMIIVMWHIDDLKISHKVKKVVDVSSGSWCWTT